ncbi:MAG TPA: hypothetical protein VNW92_06715 [Polyangiaceae bacterium]|nr:hypothetical protein [Polyangiaceae bacterium]
MRSLRVLSGLVCGAGLLFAPRARAQETPPVSAPTASPPPVSAPLELGYTVGVAASPGREPLVARLRAELSDLGFRVEEVPAELGPEVLDALTDGSRYLALVRIDETGQAIEFRIRAPGSSELLRDRVPVRRRRADVAAVATVELLRARLIKLGILRAPPPPPRPPPVVLPPTPAPAPADFPSLTADINAGVWYSAGGLGASPALVLGLRAHPKRWLAVGALGAFEPHASELSASEGDVQSSATLLGVITDFGFGTGRVRFELGGGVALSMLSLSGEASSPFAGRVTHSYGVVPVARTNLALRLAGPVSLHGEILGGVSSPRVAVRFADRTVAHWGRPLVLALIGLEVGF